MVSSRLIAPGLTMIGPAPCPIERVKRRWRWHVLLKAEHSGELTRVAHYFMRRFPVPNRAELRVTLHVPGHQAGDPVVLFGAGEDGEPTAQDWADAAGTISYEIVTRLGARVPREYVDDAAGHGAGLDGA